MAAGLLAVALPLAAVSALAQTAALPAPAAKKPPATELPANAAPNAVGAPPAAVAQSPTAAAPATLISLQATQRSDSLDLEFAVRLQLPRTVEDALQRGVPVYFVAQAQLLRSRWYWRDERIARVQRSWRVAYQPLTGTWRVALGGLSQTHATLAEALAAASRSAGWRLADPAQLDPDKRYTIEFSYRLDSSQLPGPMQLGLGGQNDWAVAVSRVLKLELRAEPEPAPAPADTVETTRPALPAPPLPPVPAAEPRADPRLDARPLPRTDDKPEARSEARPS